MQAERRIETTTRVIWSLPSPAVWVEVEKVFDVIRNDLKGRTLYDNTVTVEAWDDEIHICYTAEKGEFEHVEGHDH